MTDPLCHFAHSFPDLAARILDRDRHKRRNFKEETITDLLMAGLTAFGPFGVRVDFPLDESVTGNDMDWEFVAPHATDGRKYLRLHIQAKRAIFNQLKKQPSYWFYRELDHEAAKNAGRGSQAERLIAEAGSLAGCVPLYMFYHTLDALEPDDRLRKLPAIEGVNAMFADTLGPTLAKYPPATQKSKRWPVDEKMVEKWRPLFMPLSDLLCFARMSYRLRWLRNGGLAFLAAPGLAPFSPGALADRLNERRRQLSEVGQSIDFSPVEAVDNIPQQTRRVIERWSTDPGRAELERPRAIFVSIEGMFDRSEHREETPDA